jgi:hypothetical protein
MFQKNLSDLSTNDYIIIIEALHNYDIRAVRQDLSKQIPEIEGLRLEMEALREEHTQLKVQNQRLKKLLYIQISRKRWCLSSVKHVEEQCCLMLSSLQRLKKGLNDQNML